MDHLSQNFLALCFVLLLATVVVFSVGYIQFQFITRLNQGLKNASEPQHGQGIFIEGIVVTPNQFTTPVLELPVAAYLWEIYEKGGQSQTRQGYGATGDKISIKTLTGQTYTVSIQPDYFQFFKSDFNVNATNTWVWKNKFVQYNSNLSERIRNFAESQNIITSILGFKQNMLMKEYPLESGKKYSFLGTLESDRLICGTATDELAIYIEAPEDVLKRFWKQFAIVQMIGGAVILVILVAMFKNL